MAGKSFYYISEDTVVIIDDGICNQSDQECFSYRLITEKQNEYMRQYDHVYRFLIEDREWIDRTINIQMANMTPVIHHIIRQDSAEASPLEFMFEKNICRCIWRGSFELFRNKNMDSLIKRA